MNLDKKNEAKEDYEMLSEMARRTLNEAEKIVSDRYGHYPNVFSKKGIKRKTNNSKKHSISGCFSFCKK